MPFNANAISLLLEIVRYRKYLLEKNFIIALLELL